MDELILFVQHLKHPEYVHVLLNPLPVYATAMGVVALALALYLRSRPAQMVALIIIAIGCGSAYPVLEFGQRAYDRIYPMSEPDAQQWLDLHMSRAETFVYWFYLTAVVAVASVVVILKWPKGARALTNATLAMALVALGLAGWISHAGGQVRHPEFRSGPPPHPVPHEEHHQHGNEQIQEDEHDAESPEGRVAQPEHEHGAGPKPDQAPAPGQDSVAGGEHQHGAEPPREEPVKHEPEHAAEPEHEHGAGPKPDQATAPGQDSAAEGEPQHGAESAAPGASTPEHEHADEPAHEDETMAPAVEAPVPVPVRAHEPEREFLQEEQRKYPRAH